MTAEMLTNRRFGRLKVLSYSAKRGTHHYWLCVCDCGNTSVVRGSSLVNGETKSCGCYQQEVCSRTHKKHGMFGTKFYGSWSSMIQRCTDNNHPMYYNYGGRGITVCDKWMDFIGFYEDMYQIYEEGLTLDRIDNEKGYFKENCRWSTRKQQANNMRTNRIVTYNGRKMTLSQASEVSGIPYSVVRSRMHRGWDEEEALSIPVGGKRVGSSKLYQHN